MSLARLHETDLAANPETAVSMRFHADPPDLEGRVQSFQKLVAGGASVNEALAVSGLLAGDA